jgi:hypothetical protein
VDADPQLQKGETLGLFIMTPARTPDNVYETIPVSERSLEKRIGNAKMDHGSSRCRVELIKGS